MDAKTFAAMLIHHAEEHGLDPAWTQRIHARWSGAPTLPEGIQPIQPSDEFMRNLGALIAIDNKWLSEQAQREMDEGNVAGPGSVH